MPEQTASREAKPSETGMDLRDLLSDDDFLQRQGPSGRADRRFEALHSLARVFNEAPGVVLQMLVDIAVEFCGADSAGISLEEPNPEEPNPEEPNPDESHEDGTRRFRWIVVAGSFAQYLNGTTPRFFSPCGTCLDSGRPQLYRVTQPYYDFLGVAADPVNDGILIPWTSEKTRGTIWAVSHGSSETFTLDDYKLLNSLADFAAIAIRHQRQDELLRRIDMDKASAQRAHELAHQINNPLQSLTNMLYLASQGRADTQLFLQQAIQELQALSDLVGKLLSLKRA